MKRKLSRRAKTAKKKGDLKYANSRSREIKFKSVKNNRGNDGKGTKKENNANTKKKKKK